MPQFSFGLPVGAVCQFAFYVNDVPNAMAEYSKQLEVGPWFYMERVAIKNSYRGKPSVFNGSVAVGYAGPMQIELIHQSDTAPSVFMEADEKRRNGLHHQAVAVRDFDARIKSYTDCGFETAMYLENEFRNRIAYIDTKGHLPFFIEVVEVNDVVENVYKALYGISIDWDGKNPIRRFDSIGDLIATAGK
jgi:hypothetical protein